MRRRAADTEVVPLMRTYDNIIVGRNAVSAALRSGHAADSLYISSQPSGSVSAILRDCKKRGIPVKRVDARKLDEMSGGAVHQGVALTVPAADYSSMDDIFALSSERGEPPFIVICDGIEDPHNLGAIIRSAEASGAHGVIIPKRRNVGLTQTVAKAACGALEYMPVCRVTNISATIDELKEKGVWVYAADMDGTPVYEENITGPAAVVIGAEGSGVSRLVKEKCDFTVSIPITGRIGSLNASVAAGVIMLEIKRQRDSARLGGRS